MRKLTYLLGAMVCVAALPGSPRAAEKLDEETSGAWMLGAGLYGSLYSFGIRGSDSTGFFPSRPSVSVPSISGLSVMLERRTSPSMGYLLTLSGGYGKSTASRREGTEEPDVDALDQTSEVSAYSVGGSLGVRGTLNPGDRVELSVFGTAGVEVQHIDEEIEREEVHDEGPADVPVEETFGVTTQVRRISLAAHGGITLDYRLLDGLYLRLWTSLLSARYFSLEQSARRQEPNTIRDSEDESGFTVAAELAPSLNLVMAF